MSTSDNNSSQQGGVHIPLPPANRIVAFLGPYISLISATVATWLIVHLHVGSVFNVTQDQVASAISQGVVFILTGLLTYFGQHQWLKGHQILLAQGRVDGQGAAAGTAGAAAGANGGSPGDQANQIVADLIR